MRIVLFSHSLLSDWNHGNAHFLRGITTELLSHGHDVDVYEPGNAWSLKNLVEEQGEAAIQQFRAIYPWLTSTRYDLEALDLDRALDVANLVSVHEWYDHALVRRIGEHRAFYNAQRFTLNITRAAMVRAGYSPSIRLFEAAACATPIISDYWEGLETFFTPGKEILVVHTPAEMLHYLWELPESERVALGWRARAHVLAEHTAAHRAEELEAYIRDLQL